MLEEPLRRAALLSLRRTQPSAIGSTPFTCSHPAKHDGKGTRAMGPQLEAREGAGLATLFCHEGSAGPISRAWSGRAPNQPAAAAGATVNTCRLATTRTPAALPAERGANRVLRGTNLSK